MKIIKMENYTNDENCYILVNNGEAVVIDPGVDAESIANRAGEEGADIKYILFTHCHYDHILEAPRLKEITGAEIAATDICAANIADKNINLSRAALGRAIEIKDAGLILDKETHVLCGIEIKIIKTPGHTSCGTCFLAENHLFSGDTLFLRSMGRFDLPTGNEEILKNSIRNNLYVLGDDIEVHPGHGGDTKIGYEKRYNLCCKGLEYDNS